MQPIEDGYHGCVLCEYKTTKRKNLLVHLRKHNAWPHETPDYYHHQPERVYTSCIRNFFSTWTCNQVRKLSIQPYQKQKQNNNKVFTISVELIEFSIFLAVFLHDV